MGGVPTLLVEKTAQHIYVKILDIKILMIIYEDTCMSPIIIGTISATIGVVGIGFYTRRCLIERKRICKLLRRAFPRNTAVYSSNKSMVIHKALMLYPLCKLANTKSGRMAIIKAIQYEYGKPYGEAVSFFEEVLLNKVFEGVFKSIVSIQDKLLPQSRDTPWYKKVLGLFIPRI